MFRQKLEKWGQTAILKLDPSLYSDQFWFDTKKQGQSRLVLQAPQNKFVYI